MSKIGIITIFNVNNYGAELQTFALHYKLKSLGYDNEIINYLFFKNSKYKSERESESVLNVSKIRTLKDFVLKCFDKYSCLANPQVAKRRKERFDNFYKNNVCLSKVYDSFSALYNADLEYDTLIVGSDQVWNPSNNTNLAPYFLTFAKKGMKKISYASSFGVNKIPTSYFSVYKDWLHNIDFLSTRESDGIKIIKEITGRDATHVLDPTLLLSKQEWEKLSVPYSSNEPYILLFVFKNSKYITDFAAYLQRKTGYKIIRICKNEMRVDSDDKILNIRDFGPLEFLGLYKSASLVLTSSFHGTVFSLIFEKPFYTITPANKDNNSRQDGLLSLVELSSRLIKEDEKFPDLNNMEIDFIRTKKIIDREREKSINFLQNALKNNSL